MTSANVEQQQQPPQQQQPQHLVRGQPAPVAATAMPTTTTATDNLQAMLASFQATVPAATVRRSTAVSTHTTNTTPTATTTPHSTNVSMSSGVPSSSMPTSAVTVTAGGTSGNNPAIYPHPAHLHRVTPSQHHAAQGQGLSQGQGQGLGQPRQGSALDDIHATR